MSIDHGWTAELGSVGDPGAVSAGWVTRGTPAASDPDVVIYALLPITGLLGAVALIAAAVATVLAARRGT